MATLINSEVAKIAAKAGWKVARRMLHQTRRARSEEPATTELLEEYVERVAHDPDAAAQLLAVMFEASDRLQHATARGQPLPDLADVTGRLPGLDELAVAPALRAVYERTLARAYPWADSDTIEMGALFCALRDGTDEGMDMEGEDAALRRDAETLDRLMGQPRKELFPALASE